MGRSSSVGLMSVLSVGRRYKAGGPARKATLAILLESMGNNDGEWSCYPSMESLAEQTEQSVATVRRHVARFEEVGIIRREPRGRQGGGRSSNLFVLDLDRLMDLAEGVEQTAQFDSEDEDQSNHPTGGKPLTDPPEMSGLVDPLLLVVTGERLENGSSVAPSAATETNDPRGSRLPEPFLLTMTMQQQAALEWPGVNCREQTARFCDYWRAQPGARGRKSDWQATWRNWMRKASDDLARPSGRSQARDAGAVRGTRPSGRIAL